MALVFDLVFHQVGVLVRPHDHGRRTLHQVDAVITRPGRGKLGRLVEEVVKAVEKGV